MERWPIKGVKSAYPCRDCGVKIITQKWNCHDHCLVFAKAKELDHAQKAADHEDAVRQCEMRRKIYNSSYSAYHGGKKYG